MNDERYSVSDGTIEAGIPVSDIQSMESAGRGRRFANFLIDYVCALLFGMIVLIIILLVFGEDTLDSLPDMVVGALLMCLYYIPFEATTGRTIGKLITGTKVVNDKGQPPTLMEVVKRTLARFIPFEAFSFLVKDAYGWHDKLSDTYVVKCRGQR
jgi:uncharacterized RDD family membrane protein YckC